MFQAIIYNNLITFKLKVPGRFKTRFWENARNPLIYRMRWLHASSISLLYREGVSFLSYFLDIHSLSSFPLFSFLYSCCSLSLSFFTHINKYFFTHPLPPLREGKKLLFDAQKAAQHPAGMLRNDWCICYRLQMRLIGYKGIIRLFSPRRVCRRRW